MITLEDVTVTSGHFVLKNISLEVPTGGYGVLIGKTGCGKTTILESILGLRPVHAGKILLGGEDVSQLSPSLRGVGYVPQDGALFSRMTVRQHLSFALEIRRVSTAEINRRVSELAELLDIASLLDRVPRRLSGGERQRVALGRALSFNPRILCLDEPLSALDSQTRRQMCDLLMEIRKRTGVTTLHVTHNLDEAQRLAAPLFQLIDGRVEIVSGSSASK